MDVQGVFLFTASSINMQGVSFVTIVFLQCQNPGLYAVRHPASPEPELVKMLMPGEVRYRNKGIQSGTGMPVPMAQCRCQAMVIVNFIPPVRDYELGLRNMAVNAVVKNNFVSPSGRGFCKVVLAGPVKACNCLQHRTVCTHCTNCTKSHNY